MYWRFGGFKGSELAPAVALAYEPPEGNVMNRPPRKAGTDRLFSIQTGLYCLFNAGGIETAFCFMVILNLQTVFGRILMTLLRARECVHEAIH